jgi:molybdenum cofactor cytidylyltransferase
LIGGLVLAAGAGTRFGDGSKLLAELSGRPLLEHAVQAQCAVDEIERVVVVLGARAAEITRAVDFGRAETVVCPSWERGQSESLRCGLRALPGVSKVIVTLGDQPRISPALIERFVAQPPGARAVYGGRPGHPVVLGPDQVEALGSVSGDQGARALLGDGPLIECGELGSDVDVDTQKDLEEVRREARAVL